MSERCGWIYILGASASRASGPPRQITICMRVNGREPQQPSARSDRFLSAPSPDRLCCGTAGEAFLLIVLATSALALAPQVSALPPLAIVHDLRC